jgi:hypothetical protein
MEEIVVQTKEINKITQTVLSDSNNHTLAFFNFKKWAYFSKVGT